MEIDHLVDVGVEVGLLLDALIDLLEEGFVDECLDAAHGEVRHEVLPVAEVAEAVEGGEEVLFEIVEGPGLVVHAEPEHPRRVVAAEDARAVEVHREGLVVFGHLLASLDDLGDVVVGGVADELEGKVYLVGFAPINIAAFVFKVALELLHQGGVFIAHGDVDGQKGSFHLPYFSAKIRGLSINDKLRGGILDFQEIDTIRQ